MQSTGKQHSCRSWLRRRERDGRVMEYVRVDHEGLEHDAAKQNQHHQEVRAHNDQYETLLAHLNHRNGVLP